eukprot:TRINITY_DN548_c0_g1_i2.p1 TRINITY_DN548_c0_g1~~TRINITY_DN548_c0_g1_i2.p1  ORF type:complete len:172 (+),score=2.08 TRINITY_DN548_c0_g1_i2:405-920(+)
MNANNVAKSIQGLQGQKSIQGSMQGLFFSHASLEKNRSSALILAVESNSQRRGTQLSILECTLERNLIAAHSLDVGNTFALQDTLKVIVQFIQKNSNYHWVTYCRTAKQHEPRQELSLEIELESKNIERKSSSIGHQHKDPINSLDLARVMTIMLKKIGKTIKRYPKGLHF